jgi:predicted RNA polymerase sigma factor
VTWQDALATTVRQDWGRLVALLLAQFRRLDVVEDAPADAVEAGAAPGLATVFPSGRPRGS